MADSIGPAFHVSRVGVSSQFGGDTFTIKAHFHSREQAELAKRLLETEPLIMRPRDAELVELAERHSIRSLTNGAESRWWFNFSGLRALIDAARASSIAGVQVSFKVEDIGSGWKKQTTVIDGVAGAPAPLPLNGIPATWSHDEGAYAQCGDCGRYTLDPTALCARGMPTCECGRTSGWSGSFKRPGPEAKWSGRAPSVDGPLKENGNG